MKMEHRKDIILAMLHSFALSARHCMPGETTRTIYHSLIDTTQITGHKIFEKRNDGRHFVATIVTAGRPVRVLTVFDNAHTGSLDIDLSNNLPEELQDDIFITLYKLLSIAIGVKMMELVTHTRTHQSQLALTIAERAANLQL